MIFAPLVIALTQPAINEPAPAGKSVLMVVTSADKTISGKPTGLWLEEFAAPYFEFKKAGVKITVASLKGGPAPVDPRSLERPAEFKTGAGATAWSEAGTLLKTTAKLSSIDPSTYDALFIPGGHGTMFDFPNNGTLASVILKFDDAKKPIASVCHGPAAFVGVKRKDGTSFVKGRSITAFSNSEEVAVKLEREVPFLLESKLMQEGGRVSVGANFTPYIKVDGNLITGQNPMSSTPAAQEVLKLLRG